MSPMLQDIVQSIAVLSASYEPPDTPPTDQSSRTFFLLVNVNVFFVPHLHRIQIWLRRLAGGPGVRRVTHSSATWPGKPPVDARPGRMSAVPQCAVDLVVRAAARDPKPSR